MADKLSLSYGFVTVKENEELTEGLNIIEKLVTFFVCGVLEKESLCKREEF